MLRALLFAITLLPLAALAVDGSFDSRGVAIRYADTGRGEPVVLVGGFGESMQTWVDKGVVARLEPRFRVITLDLRGHGKSEKPHDESAYGVELALDIVRLLDHLGLARAHLVGYSLGGGITLKLLTFHPERVASATLGGSGGQIGWSPLIEGFYRTVAAEVGRRGVSRTLMSIYRSQPTEEELEKIAAERAAAGRDRLAEAALYRSLRAIALTPDEAKAIRTPVLGIAGKDDTFSASALARLKDLKPDLRVVTVGEASHAGDDDVRRSDEFKKALIEFLTGTR